MHHGFTWFEHIPFLNMLPAHIAGSIIVMLLVLPTTFLAGVQVKRAMQNAETGLIPDAKMTFKNFFEIIAEKLLALCEMVLGKHDAPKYFPIIGSLFVFIFASNLLGLIPGFLPPTDNLNTTLAFGSFVFVYYNYQGLKSNGLGYLKHFMGPVLLLAPLMFFIELASHVFRPLSLGLRLRGNIMGDHMVLSIFNDLVPYVVPMLFYTLGMFVCFVQAFVFCLLTMVYISLATAHDH